MPRILLLTVFILNVAFPNGIPHVHVLQSGTGAITVTVITESGTPIPDAYVTFRAEQERLDRGACVTDTAGRCTLFVVDAPTDAGGLIRGYLYLEDGNRPVIWPGGDLSITITTSDSGRIRPSADFIDSAKGTPTSTPTATVVQTTAVISTRLSPTGTALSALVTLTVTPTPTATPTSAFPEQQDDPLPDVEPALPLGLILLAVIGLVGVWWWGIRKYRVRREGTHS
jgi:hypothetical protein